MFSQKTFTIIAREFLVRLRSKGFIVATLLGPLAMVLLMATPILLAVFTKGSEEKSIVVLDETQSVFVNLQADPGIILTPGEGTLQFFQEQIGHGEIDGVLVLPTGVLEGESNPVFYSQGGGLSFRFELEDAVNRAVRNTRLVRSGVSEEVLEIIRERLELEMQQVSTDGEARQDDTGVMSAVGYVMGFIIYISIFIYGSLVMRGVIEEKTSRIMEIVVSSARPFQLMLGKVLGIGALGLVQMALWIGVTAALVFFGGTIAAAFIDPSTLNLPASTPPDEILAAANIPIPSIPASLFLHFLVFFVGGFLLYAAMFAAVGSAVDQESDAQQFVIPIALPVIMAIMFIGIVVDKPDSTLSVAVSLIPFFSPILMIVRLSVTHVPIWQVASAIILLILFVVGTVWLASRIYRVGILMYGKKPSFKDLFRWVRTA